MCLGGGLPTGERMEVAVAELGPEGVLLDGNHRLAGETLRFDVTLVEILRA